MESGKPATRRAVLVVEDDWLIRMEITDAFENAGWTVFEASSGEEATALRADSGNLVLLVTDIRLGGRLSGWDVAEHWRAVSPRIGVIYASANPAIAARQVPGGIFMGKPTRIAELLRASERLCEAGG
jgi:DNA-binding NtrC family response regulator